MAKIFDKFPKELFDKNDPRNFAYFTAAAVILDTENLNEELRDKKWSKEDEEARNWLAKYCTLDKTYFDRMQHNKYSSEVALGSDLYGNIRRDYKQYALTHGDLKGKFGCAVFVFSPEQMF